MGSKLIANTKIWVTVFIHFSRTSLLPEIRSKSYNINKILVPFIVNIINKLKFASCISFDIIFCQEVSIIEHR